MKVMHEEAPWPSKVNFVDENSAFLGYDLSQDCCEDAGWFLSDKKGDSLEGSFKQESMDLPGWVFDPSYLEQRGDSDGGGYAEFRIVKDGAEKFLTIYNHHNGYYGHGFKFTVPADPGFCRESHL